MRIVEADLEIRRIFLFEGFHPEGSASLAAWFLEAGRGGFGLRRRRFSKNSFKASTHLFIIIAFKLHQREPVLLTPSPSLLSPFPPLSNILSPHPLIYINNKMHGFSSKLKDAQLDNPEDLPSTPRKRPLYLEDASPPPTIPSSHNRLKFKYTVIEKPRRSWVGGLAFIGWLFLVALLFYIGYCDKLRNLRVEASLEKQKCQEDYVKNK